MSELFLQAILLGIAFSPLTISVFISMGIFKIPDIGTDGSFTLGAVLFTLGTTAGYSPWALLMFAAAGGFLAGYVNAGLFTWLKINPVLSGILMMTALYSINLFLMGRPNIPLMEEISFFSGESYQLIDRLVPLFITIAILLLLRYLLLSDYGLVLRASGAGDLFVRLNGVHDGPGKRMGFGIANAMSGLSGALVVKLQGFCDINMGSGIIISALAAYMIADRFSGRARSTSWLRISMLIPGGIVYRSALALAFFIGVSSTWFKAVTALLVLLFLVPLKDLFPLRK